ncbi:MAG: pyridoxamine 5'-phosphate oxidase [Rhodospirillales bacterium]|nr:pyridoxamine 5'-phosphate oxidase [Rhodospirillales bacterium]MDE2318939.1 pyridoxamine 5'-phosphate oxidase [Rhodospirillales bacterium]
MSEDPFRQFGAWFAEAGRTEPSDPNAMTVATVGEGGRPAARTLLLKGWNEHGFVFYSNRGSRKAQEITGNPQVALLFHWKSLQRQIRIEGAVSPVESTQADEYFVTRPRISQLGAWASEQSRPLASRAIFEERLREVEARFAGQPVPRPEFWSGWRLKPDYFEFWQGADYRLHDRLIFKLNNGNWETGYLYP